MARRPKGRPVDGWVVLDKPSHLGSTQAVSIVKRLFEAQKAGHAGTLDPLASGMLPIALGEATKTVPFAMEGAKTYRFTVRWGEETPSDDAETAPERTSEVRPTQAQIAAVLPRFTGVILQVPPRFSAIKVDGERAYDLARSGERVDLSPREVDIDRLVLLDRPDADHAVFECDCGQGTYIRSIARDMGRALGTFGHIVNLRRTHVGPFCASDMIPLEKLRELGHNDAGPQGLLACLRPLQTALDDIPALAVNQAEAARLRQGQSVILRGALPPPGTDAIYVACRGEPVAIADLDRGMLKPRRVFNANPARS
jgi:tRNA pseudouridine55 synthase